MGIGLNVEMFESINEMFNKFSIRDEKISVQVAMGLSCRENLNVSNR